MAGPASPDSGPDDSQVPLLPTGWIAQWDSRQVRLQSSYTLRVRLSPPLQTTTLPPSSPIIYLSSIRSLTGVTAQLEKVLLRANSYRKVYVGQAYGTCTGRTYPFQHFDTGTRKPYTPSFLRKNNER